MTNFHESRVFKRKLPDIHRFAVICSENSSKRIIPEQYHESLISILNKYPNIFTKGNRFGCVKDTSIKINLKKIVVHRNPYRLTAPVDVQDIVSDLLENERK